MSGTGVAEAVNIYAENHAVLLRELIEAAQADDHERIDYAIEALRLQMRRDGQRYTNHLINRVQEIVSRQDERLNGISDQIAAIAGHQGEMLTLLRAAVGGVQVDQGLSEAGRG